MFNPEIHLLTPEELEHARDWLKECCCTFRDLDEEDVDDLTDKEIDFAVTKYYSGGVPAFKAA